MSFDEWAKSRSISDENTLKARAAWEYQAAKIEELEAALKELQEASADYVFDILAPAVKRKRLIALLPEYKMGSA